MGADPNTDPDAYLAENGIEYLARDVIVMVGRRSLTSDGVLAVTDGTVVIFEDGEGPAVDRTIAAVPAADATLVSKPRIGLGASMVLTLGDTTYKVMPEATYVGKTFGVRGRIKRARESVTAFESALEDAQRA